MLQTASATDNFKSLFGQPPASSVGNLAAGTVKKKKKGMGLKKKREKKVSSPEPSDTACFGSGMYAAYEGVIDEADTEIPLNNTDYWGDVLMDEEEQVLEEDTDSCVTYNDDDDDDLHGGGEHNSDIDDDLQQQGDYLGATPPTTTTGASKNRNLPLMKQRSTKRTQTHQVYVGCQLLEEDINQ